MGSAIQLNITHLFTHNQMVKQLYLTQREPVSNVNEGVLHILQSSKTGSSSSDCLVSYPGHSSYPSAEIQSVYSTAPVDLRSVDKK